jgi:hypothetical protein
MSEREPKASSDLGDSQEETKRIICPSPTTVKLTGCMLNTASLQILVISVYFLLSISHYSFACFGDL